MAPRSHARLSPSSASRWLNCLGSVNFIDELDEEEDGSIAADEGTILHTFCEDCLRERIDPFDLVDEEREHNGYRYALTERDAEQIQAGIDYIDEIPGKLFIEKRLDLGRWMPGQFGTSDRFSIGKRRLTVWDWKWGYLPVSPVKHEQTMIYGLGVYDNFIRGRYPDIDTVRLIIEQPRAPGGGGEWDISIDDLLDFGDFVKKRAAMTYRENAPRTPGEKQCLYCPGAKKRLCPEYDQFNLDMIVSDFDELDEAVEYDLPMRMPKPALLTPERRSFIIKHRAVINKYLDRLHAEAMDDAVKGRPTPGLKAVLGRGPARRWKDKEAAEEKLLRVLPRDKAFTEKMISPAKAEELLSDRLFMGIVDLIDKGERKPILVPEEDARKAVRTIVDEFED